MTRVEERMGKTLGELAMEAALLALTVRERRPTAELLERVAQGDRRLNSELRLCLAWSLQHFLRRDFPEVRSVHVIGSVLEDEARPVSDLDLVLLVPRADPALRARLDEVNRDVSRCYAEAVPGLPPEFRLLDLHLLTEDDDPEGRRWRPLLRGSGLPSYLLPQA